MMTSAVMSSQSAVVKKRKSWISDDDISSDVITISSELQYNQSMSKDDVPVASSCVSIRKLQCFAFPVDKNPDTVVEVSTSSEAVDEFYYEDLRKLDVNC
ncbi:hypothetical protein F511_14308 [Dorcoceras hygrometricum]|uniref:Uncharacterized protein n=1 Tax=Dorcoceras hygrometricum TaxID=472368 RepID=A0A2Z7CVZ9_9LAMI|nr:hypothetical protein F511_14308 [Dorcoceras hygrometricum]